MQTMISYFFGQNNEKTTTAAATTTVKCCISFSTQVFAETKSRYVNRTFRKVLSHFSLKSLGNSSGKFAQRSEGLYYIPLFINTSLTFKFASPPLFVYTSSFALSLQQTCGFDDYTNRTKMDLSTSSRTPKFLRRTILTCHNLQLRR